MRLFSGWIAVLLLACSVSCAQTVQPVIVEYKDHADGRFTVTNNSDAPMAVVLEPKSFSITPEGKGIFRPLDPGIHVELSRNSVRLQPRQSYMVFYKATADSLPAWFTVYASFSKPVHSDELDVRIMLPHTVYLYQKGSIAEAEVQVTRVAYSAEHKKITFTLINAGRSLARVQDLHATGGHNSADSAGFPLLPGATRQLDFDWSGIEPPSDIAIRFEHFTLRRPIAFGEDAMNRQKQPTSP